MKGSVYVKESPDKGRGVYAARVIRKDEVILEFNGPSVKIESLDGIPREVQDHLFNIGPGEYLIVREPSVRVYSNHLRVRDVPKRAIGGMSCWSPCGHRK
jgi:SET domain-containing protein